MATASVVIPTYNRVAQLERVLDGLSRQTLPADRWEIIVVSDGSTDGTDARIGDRVGDVRLELVSQANQGPAVARNNGVAAASGELILFLDDDVIPEPEWASVHLDTHRANPDTVVIGPLLTPADVRLQPWVQWEQRMLEKQYAAMARGDWGPTARQFYTGNASLPRHRFVDAGGFDPSFLRGEDVELAYRLRDRGMAFTFEPAARAFHHAARSFESWLSIARAYGRNEVLLVRDRQQTWTVPTARAEFEQRNPLTRFYTRLGLRHPSIERTSSLAAPLSEAAERIGLGSAGQALLSAVYNLAYYRGLSQELGGAAEFLAVEPASRPGPPKEQTNR